MYIFIYAFGGCIYHTVATSRFGIAVNARFTTNGMCAKNNMSCKQAITEWSRQVIYCCLLPQCEALHTCRSGFPIATKWCCDQDVKVVPGAGFAKKNVWSVWFVVKGRACCCNLSADVALNMWFTTNGMCAKNNTHMYMWREQTITE